MGEVQTNMDEVRRTGRWKVSSEAKLSPDRIQKEKGKTNLRFGD